MSQTSTFHIPNLSGAEFRSLANKILAALADQNAGSTEPENPFPGMVWLDTSQEPHKYLLRNSSNTAWVTIFTAEHPPTKAQIELSLVANYAATASLTDGSANKYLLAAAGKALQDNKLDKTGQAYDSARLGSKLASQYVLISGTYTNLRAQATTKDDVGLSNVQNYGLTSSLTTNNANLYASAKAVYDLNNAKVNKSTTINGKPLSSSINLTARNVGATTPEEVDAAVKNAMPAGAIILWAGTEAQIPTGYKLCNGSGQTSNGIQIPDLRNRFIVGAGSTYNPRNTGGSNSKNTNTTGAHSHSISVGNTTLSVSQMPSHQHDNSFGVGGGGSNRSEGQYVGSRAGLKRTLHTGGSGSHNHSGSSGSAGNHSHSVDVRPPYYALCYIIKL